MSKKRVAKWARDMWQMFEALPQNAHSDRVDFEIKQVLINNGIEKDDLGKC